MQNDRTYYKRISDKVLDLKLRAFGATNIVGPKWCGKTETALQKAKSSLPDDCSWVWYSTYKARIFMLKKKFYQTRKKWSWTPKKSIV